MNSYSHIIIGIIYIFIEMQFMQKNYIINIRSNINVHCMYIIQQRLWYIL